MTLRNLIIMLLEGEVSIDDQMLVKIFRRDSAGNVMSVAYLNVRRIDSANNICVEESEIVWRPFR